MTFGTWDITLIAVVSVQATILAYLYAPKWKAFILSLPVPFTIACLAVGQRLGVTNVWGLGLLLIFTYGVKLLHYDLRWPIVPSIVTSALVYCAGGFFLARALPDTDVAFWIAAVAMFAIATFLFLQSRHREERGHRTTLPIWIKLPIIVAVVVFLMVIKRGLQGFVTVFPMVGVIAAYEARSCLWTVTRQIPVFTIPFLPMMAVIRLTQTRLGLPLALILGWPVFLLGLCFLTRLMHNLDAARRHHHGTSELSLNLHFLKRALAATFGFGNNPKN
jgi:hypothetical protein